MTVDAKLPLLITELNRLSLLGEVKWSRLPVKRLLMTSEVNMSRLPGAVNRSRLLVGVSFTLSYKSHSHLQFGNRKFLYYNNHKSINRENKFLFSFSNASEDFRNYRKIIRNSIRLIPFPLIPIEENNAVSNIESKVTYIFN